jgi:hypothetical protein
VIISTLWITRKGEDRLPELVEAWDEGSIDENYEGWVEACKKALAAIGDDLVEQRVLDINIPYGKLLDAFNAPVVEGEVV